MNPHVVIILLIIGLGSGAGAQSLETARTKYRASLAEYSVNFTRLEAELAKRYRHSLKSLLDAQIQRGQLEYVLALKQEMDFLEGKGKPAPVIPDQYADLKKFRITFRTELEKQQNEKTTRLIALVKSYDSLLARLQNRFTVDGRIDEALAVRKERQTLDWKSGPRRIENLPGVSKTAGMQNGLILHYNFDRKPAGSVSDSSGHQRDGKSVKTKWVRLGRIKEAALEFDGEESHVLLPAEVTDGLEAFSISFWMKSGMEYAKRSYFTQPTLIGNDTAGTQSGDFGITTSEGYIGFWNGLREDQTYLSDKTSICDGNWHHIALTCGSGGIVLFVDGKLETQQPAPVRGLNSSPLALGGSLRDNGFGSAHKCMLDDLRIWNRPLSEKEVRQVYSSWNGRR